MTRTPPTCPRDANASPVHTSAPHPGSMSRVDRISREIASLARVLATPPRQESIADAVEIYLHSVRGRDAVSTEENREYRFGQLVAVFGDVVLSEWHADLTAMFMSRFPAGSQHAVATTIAPFFRWASRSGWAGAEEWAPISKGSRQRDRWMSELELASALRALDAYERAPRSRQTTVDALRVCLTTACRPGEVVTLTASEVSPCGTYLRLIDTKTGDRSVPLGPVVASVLRRRKADSHGCRSYLFEGRQSRGHMLRSSLSHAWRRLADGAGLHDVRLYDARHTWATMALRNGENLETIRRALGHSHRQMTARYAHLADTDVRDMAVRVERLLLGTKQYQLDLPLSGETRPLTPTQRRLMGSGREFSTRGPGEAQAALSLLRAGMIERRGPGLYSVTQDGRRALL